MATCGQKRKREHKHPYLSGNFAPVQQTTPLTRCTYTGVIPDELVGGEYVRNGGNPVTNEDLGRDAHWFDGDGMLAGVVFRRSRESEGQVRPEFVNQYIMTDIYLSTLSSPRLRSPILPSIATLVNPASKLICVILRVFRTILLVLLSHLPGSKQAIKKISVANTSILYHDGRALATCESGPPLRVQLPGLETVGWYNGHYAEGEPTLEKANEPGFGGNGLLSFLKEWTTAHPKVDPVTNEMILYHCTFAPPYIHYSVIPASQRISSKSSQQSAPKLLNAPVRGMSGAKMMHDFGASRTHTIIMDLPLSLDPLNLAKNKPVVAYDSSQPSRFGIFSRRNPSNVRWFETSACCIFHTANAWDSYDAQGNVAAVNLLACRLTSASLVFSAGNIAAPQPTKNTVQEVKKAMPFFGRYDFDEAYAEGDDKLHSSTNACGFDKALELESPHLEREAFLSPHTQRKPTLSRTTSSTPDADIEADQCRLYYYRFALHSSQPHDNTITHQYALSALPFEFPSLRPDRSMSCARYIYGCSTSATSFGTALGRAVKIDVLVKMDARTLIERGERDPPRSVTGCVDTRTVEEVLRSDDPEDPIRCFRMPAGWYAQEPRFVPRAKGGAGAGAGAEDDGFLLFYTFDEAQLDSEGECPPDAVSELWILDARNMWDVLARVRLPQRVPYGLHGNWFSEEEIGEQRPVERVRSVEGVVGRGEEGGVAWRGWMGLRRELERLVG